MTTQNNVIEKIRSFLPVTNQVTMINTYRGVPISYDGQLIAIDDSAVKIKVHKFQAVCMELTKRTFFSNEFLPTVHGYVVDRDLQNNTVIVRDLVYTDDDIGNRQSIRVSPKDPIPVIIRRKNSPYQIVASLVDISVIGVGVYWISVFLEEIRSFTKNADVVVALTLPTSDENVWTELELPGKILNVIPLDGIQKYRLGLRMTTDDRAQLQIKDYIAFQQSEIIRELKVLHGVLLRLSHQREGHAEQ